MNCADGISRPLVRGELQTGNGEWEGAAFLVDTGSDQGDFRAFGELQFGLSAL